MKKAVFALALLVGLAAVTGCLGGEVEPIDADVSPEAEPTEVNETGEEVLSSALNATEEAESYRVESRNRFLIGASRFFNVDISMNSTGRFDVTENESIVNSRGSTDFAVLSFIDNETAFETSVYARGETAHRKATENGETTGWSESEANYTATEDVFGTEAPFRINNGTETELLGEETVGGTETYALSMNASRQTLRGVTQHSSAAVALGAGGFDQREQDIEEETEQPTEGFNATGAGGPEVYLWVDQETRRPVRLAYLLSIGPDTEGGNEGEGTLDGAISFLYEAEYTYEDVSVEDPDGV